MVRHLLQKTFQRKNNCITLQTRLFFLLLLACASLPLNSVVAGKANPQSRIFTVTIDAGHGGRSPGAMGKKSSEKDLTLAIALKLGYYIETLMNDVKVVYTRKSDVFVPLEERAGIANRNNSDLFISIHVNGYKLSSPMGTSSYVMGSSKSSQNFELVQQENKVILLEEDYQSKYEGFNPNSPESYIIFSLYQNTNLVQSLAFATMVQDNFRITGEREDRGVYQEPFLVLWKTTMPSVLIETGFITNPLEEEFLVSEKGQDVIASSIFSAFKKYREDLISGETGKTDIAAIKPADTVKELSKQDTTTIKPAIHGAKKDSLHVKINIQAPRKDSQPVAAQGIKEDVKPVVTGAAEKSVSVSPNIEFRVQVLASLKKLPQTAPDFKGQTGFVETYIDGYYKYLSQSVKTHSEAVALRKSLLPYFKGAFIVAFKDGKRIPIEEAIPVIK